MKFHVATPAELKQEKARFIQHLWEFLEWTKRKQPGTALVQHHGFHSTETFFGRVRVQVTTRGPFLLFIFGLADEVATGVDFLDRAFTELDTTRLLDVAAKVGRIRDTWNGKGANSYSVVVDRPAGSLIPLIARYGQGCQKTGKDHDVGSVFCRCSWYTDGKSQIQDLPKGWL